MWILSLFYLLGIVGFFFYVRKLCNSSNSFQDMLSDIFLSLFWILFVFIWILDKYFPSLKIKINNINQKIKKLFYF
jgi:hypothetical protein